MLLEVEGADAGVGVGVAAEEGHHKLRAGMLHTPGLNQAEAVGCTGEKKCIADSLA